MVFYIYIFFSKKKGFFSPKSFLMLTRTTNGSNYDSIRSLRHFIFFDFLPSRTKTSYPRIVAQQYIYVSNHVNEARALPNLLDFFLFNNDNMNMHCIHVYFRLM